MNIIHVIDYFQPKLGYQETFLALAQINAGHNVFVITSDRYAPDLFPATRDILGERIIGPGSYIEEGIRVYRLPILFEYSGRVWILGIKKKILELNPDAIIIHGIFSMAAIQIAAMREHLPRTKMIFDDHMVYSATRGWVWFIYKIFRQLVKRYIEKAADSLIATTIETKEFMVDIYGLPRDRIKIVPIGINTNLFRHNPNERKLFREYYNLSDDDIIFVYAGKIIPTKGPHILVEAALSLMNKHPEIKVILVGNGDENYVRHIASKIETSGLHDHFILLPLVPNNELPKIYSAVDVGVWPLQCSTTMLEAISCNVPIIISDNSGTPERASQGNGLLYHGNSSIDLALKMEIMLDNEIRSEMSLKSRAFAETLDWVLLSRQFLED
jgi:glycosyltransferase involved in cell wall biosynthesis